MKLVVFRHAEKIFKPSYDPPLSNHGQQQAQKIAQEVFAKKLPPPRALMASTRIRTQQSFQPTADMLKLKIKISPLLDEKQPNESTSDFRRRIQELLVLIQMDYLGQDAIYLCTHFDWIEEFLSVIECSTDLMSVQYHSWAPAQWMLLEKTELWDLEKFARIEV